MSVTRVSRSLNEWLMKDPNRTRGLVRTLYEEQQRRSITYQNRPIPTFPRPCFITKNQYRNISASARTLMACAERVIDAYMRDERVRKTVGLEGLEHRYASMECGYRPRVQVARPDGFLHGAWLRFLEFNADSPAGVAWTDLHEQLFLEQEHMAPLASRLGRSRCRKIHSEALLRAYEQFSGGSEKPSIAIVDWKEVTTRIECFLNKEYFERLGFEAVVADPREAELRRGKLYLAGKPVQLVYRRAIIGELIERRDEPGVSDFLRAYETQAACFVNPFSAKIAGAKSFFEVLSSPEFDNLFTRHQNDTRRKVVPFTRVLRPRPVSFGGRRWDIFELAARRKDEFVIKPTFGYGGRGVHIGRETASATWSRMVNDAARQPGRWTLQKYVPIPEEDFPVVSRTIRLERRKINLNPYLFGGRYAGIFARLSKSSVINVSQGGGMVPVFVLK